MPFEPSYYNLQLKIGKFLKFLYTKNFSNDNYLKKKFYEEGINSDRSYIEKILFERYTSNKNITDKKFNNEVKKFLKEGNYKVDEKDIEGETSYNMVNQYKFRHLVYYEYILPIERINKK